MTGSTGGFSPLHAHASGTSHARPRSWPPSRLHLAVVAGALAFGQFLSPRPPVRARGRAGGAGPTCGRAAPRAAPPEAAEGRGAAQAHHAAASARDGEPSRRRPVAPPSAPARPPEPAPQPAVAAAPAPSPAPAEARVSDAPARDVRRLPCPPGRGSGSRAGLGAACRRPAAGYRAGRSRRAQPACAAARRLPGSRRIRPRRGDSASRGPTTAPRLRRGRRQVGDVEVDAESAGHPDLDRAAVDAVRRWRFEPGRRGAEAIGMWVAAPRGVRLE